MSGPASSALTASRIPRPNPAIWAGLVGSSDAGTRAPELDTSTAGSPLSANGRCSLAAQALVGGGDVRLLRDGRGERVAQERRGHELGIGPRHHDRGAELGARLI